MDLRNRVLYDFGHGQVLNMDDIHDPVIMQKVKKNLQEKPASDMTLDETMSLEHIRLHEEHAGHDVMHFKIIVIVVVTLILAQLFLLFWKRYHYRSYQLASLTGLWLIPMIVSLRNFWWRFVSVWLFFSIVTGMIFKKCLQQPISRTIPRLVYHWFFGIHRVSYAAGVVGYTLLIASFFGANIYLTFIPEKYREYSVMMVYYGLYFGVLGRDIAEICSDRLAAQMGYYSTNGMPTRALRRDVCAVCGNEMACTAGNCMGGEKVYILNCSHNAFPDAEEEPGRTPGNYCDGLENEKNVYVISVTANGTMQDSIGLWSGADMSALSWISTGMCHLICHKRFHEFCIRGWCIVGKKQTCPCCREKVDLQQIFRNPWEKTHILYTQILDFIRYIVAWQPLILSMAQLFTTISGYK